MWRNGSAGQGEDLIDFFRKECADFNTLIISNLSYRCPDLPVGGLFHINVDGELELTVRDFQLLGRLNVKSIDFSDPCNPIQPRHKPILINAVAVSPTLQLDRIQNYHENNRVSLYSGDPCEGYSWSFHCALPATKR